MLQTYFTKLLIALFIAIALLHFTIAQIPTAPKVNFLDIGQGDSILIMTEDLHTILIDGGPGETVLERLGEELPFFVRDIDIVVLTHPHRDHIEGLIEVLRRYRVHHVLISGDEYGSGLYAEFLRLVREKEAEGELMLHFADSSKDFQVSDLYFDVIYPIAIVAGKEFENTNNASVVMKMSSAGQTFLFTGDCESECEDEILDYYAETSQIVLDTDVLKVGHHGSRTSTGQKFLDMVSPQIAVIQSGAGNDYKHPHPETLEKLQNADVEIHRNDLEGTVTLNIFVQIKGNENSKQKPPGIVQSSEESG